MRKCLCGCGGRVSKSTNKYIHGHSMGGRHHSSESKEKISRTVRKTMSDPEIREELRRRATGVPKSHESRLKTSRTITTLLSNGMYYYRGYHYITQYEFKILRKRVLDRDNNACVVCGKISKPLTVHHVVPTRLAYKNRYCDHESNMVTLCISCHNSIEPKMDLERWRESVCSLSKYLARFKYDYVLAEEYG
jgi:5-methylcytosine-specific restriction endonuclease McrA